MIHKTAIIDPAAKLGENVSVGPYTTIDADTVIGDNCVIGPRVSVMPYTTIGSGCKIHAGAVLGDLPQDLSYEDCESFVKIGDNCTLRECVTVQRGDKSGTTTSMGNNCMIMAYSHLGHNAKMCNNVIMATHSGLAGHAEVADNVFISSFVGIHQFCKVGRLAMIGGIVSVTKDVLPYSMMANNKLNVLAGMNIVGMRRAGIDAAGRKNIKAAFKLIFHSDLKISDAMAEIEKTLPAELSKELADFVAISKRGLCRPETKK